MNRTTRVQEYIPTRVLEKKTYTVTMTKSYNVDLATPICRENLKLKFTQHTPYYNLI